MTHLGQTSREAPKSAPYLRVNKTRKPLFLQLETTKALKKLKFEENFSEFFSKFFSKSPVCRIVPKNVEGGTLWDFLNIYSVANHQKIDRGGEIKNFGKKMRNLKSHSAEKRAKVS